jgi:hypothetical protein
LNFLIYARRHPEKTVGTLRVWDDDGRSIKLDHAKFIDIGPFSRGYLPETSRYSNA